MVLLMDSSTFLCSDFLFSTQLLLLFYAPQPYYRIHIRAVTIHTCHDPIRFDSVRSRSNRFNPIHYPFFQTNTTKMYNSEFHLNDLLIKIMMNKIMINNVHKIHQPVTVILYCLFCLIKINLLAFSGNNAIEEVKIVDRFSESIQEF